jgi:hypothetical protein
MVSVCIDVGSWWFCINPTPFLWNSGRLNCTLESSTSGEGAPLQFQMADLRYFLIIDVKYLEIQSMNSIYNNLVLLETLGVVLKAGWLIDYLLFYVPPKNCSLIWRRHHSRWSAAKFRPMLGAQGLWAGSDLYRAIPALTQILSFYGFIRRTTPFSRLLWHTKGCGESILTWILTGPQLVASYDTQGDVEDLF